MVMPLACSDSVAEVDQDGSSSEATTSPSTAIATVGDSTGDGGSTSSVSTSGSTTGSEADSTSSDTGTTEPPHETDWRLCEIEVSCGQEIVDEPKRSCHMTVMERDGYVVYDGPAGFENRGRSSQGWPKHQYSVELWQTPNVELVSPGSTWRYHDGPDPVPGWQYSGFDDSGWAQGDAPLGYGILGPQWTRGGQPWATVAQIPNTTTIGFGPDPANKHITSWYRADFEVADAASLDPVELHIRADDGAVVYVNGTEAARFNMPTGPIGPDTLAASSIASLEEVEFTELPIDGNLLVDGTNVIAVEVHQYLPNSSDVVLDLALSTKPPDAKANFFEFGREEDWILNGMYFDLSLYRNKLMYDLFTAFDPVNNYGPQGHYCELTLDGDWRGIYTLGEKVKRDDDRVDIAAEMGNGESFIFKSDITQIWIVTNGIGWQLVYPKEHGMTQATADGLTAFMSGFGQATAGMGNVWDYVEMASLVDWVLLQELARNGDAYRSSMHIYKDVGGKIEFVPWDFDIGLGGACSGTVGWLWRGTDHWLNSIAADPVFQAALVARWAELRETVLTDEAVDDRVTLYAKTMTLSKIHDNFDRWPHDEIIGGDDWVLIFRENCPVSSWEEEHALVQQWLHDRMEWMDQNIDTFG